MGMYSLTESFDGSVAITDTLESIMEDVNLLPADGDNFEEMAMEAVIDTHRNYNSIMESVGIMELNYLEQTGKEMVYTEGTLSDMFEAVKKFILKIWDKIKAFFKRFVMLFDAYFKDDKAFVDKYKKQIFSGRSTTDFEFKGYPFKDIGAVSQKVIGNIESKVKKVHVGWDEVGTPKKKGQAIPKGKHHNGIADYDNSAMSDTDIDTDNKNMDKSDEKYDDEFERYRGEVLDKPGSFTDSEFKKEYKEMLYGSEEKEDLDGDHLNPNSAVTRLIGNKNGKKVISDAFKASKKNIDTGIKEVEAMHREASKFDAAGANKAGNKMRHINVALRWMRDSRAMLAAVDGITLQALKTYSRQDKMLLVAFMRHTPKKEGGFLEGGSMNWEHEDETARSFLGSINLV